MMRGHDIVSLENSEPGLPQHLLKSIHLLPEEAADQTSDRKLIAPPGLAQEFVPETVEITNPTRNAKNRYLLWASFDCYFSRLPSSERTLLDRFKPFFFLQKEKDTSYQKRPYFEPKTPFFKVQQTVRQFAKGRIAGEELQYIEQQMAVDELARQFQTMRARQKFYSVFKPQKKVSQLSSQLLFYKKYLHFLSSNTQSKIQYLLRSQNEEAVLHDLAHSSRQSYLKLHRIQVLKSICDGFRTKYQQSHLIDLLDCQSVEEAQQKIVALRRTVKKKRKIDTYCQICFNHRLSISGSVKTCGECGARFHVSCFGTGLLRSECQSCQEKHYFNKSKGCNYCGLKGLPVKSVNFQDKVQNYHPACIILAGKAVYNQGKIEPTHPLPRKSEIKCKICNQNCGYLVNCEQCWTQMHPLCAYFAGFRCETSVGEGMGMQVRVSVHCCGKDWNTMQQEVYRKALINYKGYYLKLQLGKPISKQFFSGDVKQEYYQ